MTETVARADGSRPAMSVRLPRELHTALRNGATQRGVSMNDFVCQAVAAGLERPDLQTATRTEDVSTRIAQDALQMGPEAVGPLKGIARHCMNRNQVALASVLYVAAARLIVDADGPESGSQELARTAGAVESADHVELATTLWREAVALDPNNLTAVNRLGQRLHHQAQHAGDDLDRYREAAALLARVTFMDNHAKLFHGWSSLIVSRSDGDIEGERRATAEIVEALKHWAFGQRDGTSRRGWARHLHRLRELGLLDAANELVDFANKNAAWGPITPAGD